MKAKHIFLIIILFFCGVSLNAQNQALDFLKAKPHDGDPTIEETVSWLNEKWLKPIKSSGQQFPMLIDEIEYVLTDWGKDGKLSVLESASGHILIFGFLDQIYPKMATIFLQNIDPNSISEKNDFITLKEWRRSTNPKTGYYHKPSPESGIGITSGDGCSKVNINGKINIVQFPISNYKYKVDNYYRSSDDSILKVSKVKFEVSSWEYYILKSQITLAFNYLIKKTSGIGDQCWYGACLLGETKINSNKNMFESIDQLKINDSIISYSVRNKQYFQTTITGIDSVYHNNLVELQYENDTITCTDDHPFFIENKGWCSLNPEKTMRNYSNYPKVNLLEKGDSFLSSSDNGITTIKLEDIKFLTKGEMTYTITGLKKGNTYFANGILTGVEILENPF